MQHIIDFKRAREGGTVRREKEEGHQVPSLPSILNTTLSQIFFFDSPNR